MKRYENMINISMDWLLNKKDPQKSNKEKLVKIENE